VTSALAIAAVYVAAVIAADRAAHAMVYPIVGFGHPLMGRRRWLVRIFAPFIFVAVIMVCAPIFLLIVLAVASNAGRGAR
jgi:hypothetical protein